MIARTVRSGVQSNVIATGGEVEAVLMACEFYRVRVVEAAPAGHHSASHTGAILLFTGWFLLAAACPRASAAPADPGRFAETRRLMGVPWTITVHAPAADAAAAIAAGFAEVARLERILSDYDAASELSRLSSRAPTREPVEVGEDLWRVLSRAVEIRDATDAAFDPTVGPLTSLWRQARRTGRLPAGDRLAAARQAVGPETLRLVPTLRAVSLERPGMRLDLGGIGMGYAVDRALEVIGRHGIGAAMVDASGDIGVSGPPPGSPGWSIAIAPVRAGRASPPAPGDEGERLILVHQAVTTSGDAFQAVEIAGRRYSHIVDPRTGLGIAGPAAVTVLAGDCTTADALATAASVLGPDRGLRMIAAEPGCSARFVWQEDGKFRNATSSGWPTQGTQTPR